MIEAVSHSPCCWSITTAAYPSRAIVSAIIGEASVHHEEKPVSSARSRWATANAVTVTALYKLRDRLTEKYAHLRANLLLGNALRLQILCNFMQNVVDGGFLEIREHDFLGVSLCFGAAFAENAGSPESQQLVAAGHRLESQLLVMRELLLEAILALVECGHAALAVNAGLMQTESAPLLTFHLRIIFVENRSPSPIKSRTSFSGSCACDRRIACTHIVIAAMHIVVPASRQHPGAVLRRNCEVENVMGARLCWPD